MSIEQLCALALKAVDDEDARPVLFDAIEEIGWSHDEVIPSCCLSSTAGDDCRLWVVSVLLFSGWPASWPLAERCVLPLPLPVLEDPDFGTGLDDLMAEYRQ